MPVSALASAATQTTTTSDARARLSDNYDTFLLLLTAQLQNQDPLAPMDSTQFTEQLVQYSQVEQQIRTNDQLESLVAHYQAASAGAALAYLGRDAIVEGDAASLRDDAAQWGYSFEDAAASVLLRVMNASGRVVYEARGEGAAGEHVFTWDGRDNEGAAQPEGAYTLSVVAADVQGEAVSAALTGREQILGVDFSGTAPLVITSSGTRELSAIRAILDD